MLRLILLGLLPLGLAACAQWPGSVQGWRAGGAPAGHYDFNWQLSGDPSVAPLQVFSGAGRTWLQFAPGRIPPALFAQTPSGLQPLSYTLQEPYLIVDGIWPALVLQGGRHVARVERQAALPVSAPAAPPASTAAGRGGVPIVEPPGAAPLSSAPALPAPHTPLTRDDTPSRFRAGAPDATLRAVLARWAAEAGWSFEPQHWAVDADIPLAGSADFPADFKAAVRGLLASTELADRPVQPCFYANKVLRVVPFAQACDRSATSGARP